MEQQLTLLPAARNTDPASSHLAAGRMNENGCRVTQMMDVLKLVKLYPGCTSAELATKSTYDRYQVARRLSDLRASKLVTSDNSRACTINRKLALAWMPVKIVTT